jgi:peptidyl-tRNA hydrolase, PTH1 family
MPQFIFIGLGNVGPKFANTRHNVGIAALRSWVSAKEAAENGTVQPWHEAAAGHYQLAIVTSPQAKVHCLFPTTMMNESGKAVAAYLTTTSLPLSQMVVIHDEAELALGEIKVTAGGSAKGHNGVRSIQQTLDTKEFQRVRLGIGRPPHGIELSEFVLEKFLPEEQVQVQRMTEEAIKKLSWIISEEPSTRL